ncbi:MAG: GTP cyclohydrolase I [Nitrososphaerota archaeon]|nr:GTP cyclohydrolase I [Nitrososphaerota archaeon]
MHRDKIASLVRKLLVEIGEDPDREGLRETPQRVAELFSEIFGGYRTDSELTVNFAEKGNLVALRSIEFYSVCEHHLLPFFGKAHIVYQPDGKVFGASKIVRLTEKYTRRLQIQERTTTQIAEELMEHGARGVYAMLEADHLCMKMRGVKNDGVYLVTSAERGTSESPGLRNEALELTNRRGIQTRLKNPAAGLDLGAKRRRQEL